MSKKTPKIAPANISQNSTPDRITGFTTADKLTDFNPNFNPDFDPQNEAKKRSSQSIYNRSTKPATEGRVTTYFTSTPKEVVNRSTNTASTHPQISKKTKKKTTANQPYVGKKQPREEIQKNIFEYIPESIRAHAFVWTVEVPSMMDNWNNDKRAQYLDRHDISYVPLGIFGGGQRLTIMGHKVWLTNKSLIIYR